MDRSPVAPDAIVPRKELVQDLLRVQPNGSFRNHQMMEAIRQIAERKLASQAAGWEKVAADDKLHEWARRMALRVRTMMRHVSVASMKNKSPPSWFRLLGLPDVSVNDKTDAAESGDKESEEEDVDTGCGEADAACASSPSLGRNAAATDKYVFGYSRELNRAFRAPVDKPKQQELCECFVVPPGAQPHDCMVAKWSDGMEHNIVDLTVGEFRQASKAPQHQVGLSRLGNSHYFSMPDTSLNIDESKFCLWVQSVPPEIQRASKSIFHVSKKWTRVLRSGCSSNILASKIPTASSIHVRSWPV